MWSLICRSTRVTTSQKKCMDEKFKSGFRKIKRLGQKIFQKHRVTKSALLLYLPFFALLLLRPKFWIEGACMIRRSRFSSVGRVRNSPILTLCSSYVKFFSSSDFFSNLNYLISTSFAKFNAVRQFSRSVFPIPYVERETPCEVTAKPVLLPPWLIDTLNRVM